MPGRQSNISELPVGDHPPQFGLRSLMLAVAVCGAVFALMAAIGPLWSITLAFSLALVVAHVFGNSLGARLGDGPVRQSLPEGVAAARQGAGRLPVAAAQRLRERTGISRAMMAAAAGGAIAGAAAGACALEVCVGDRASIAALALGTVSSGVLGGFFGFLLSSFCSVAGRALREALTEPASQSVRPRAHSS